MLGLHADALPESEVTAMMNDRPFDNLAAQLAARGTAPLAANTKLHPSVVANAEKLAKDLKPKRKYTRKTKTPMVRDSAAAKLNDEVLATARELAGGDMRRVQFLPDGSAIVHNNPIRPIRPQDNR